MSPNTPGSVPAEGQTMSISSSRSTMAGVLTLAMSMNAALLAGCADKPNTQTSPNTAVASANTTPVQTAPTATQAPTAAPTATVAPQAPTATGPIQPANPYGYPQGGTTPMPTVVPNYPNGITVIAPGAYPTSMPTGSVSVPFHVPTAPAPVNLQVNCQAGPNSQVICPVIVNNGGTVQQQINAVNNAVPNHPYYYTGHGKTHVIFAPTRPKADHKHKEIEELEKKLEDHMQPDPVKEQARAALRQAKAEQSQACVEYKKEHPTDTTDCNNL